jgi:hypothetical protein
MENMNIFKRINEVRKKCAFIKKNKEVTGAGNYMAVTHDKVTAELREHLIEQGIVIVPRLVSSRIAETGTATKNNIPILRYEAKYEIDLVNCDDPSDKLMVPIESHALDSGDKAPGKAASYATKYVMLKLFSIETGDNEEERLHEAKIRQDKGKITPAAGAMERVVEARREPVTRVASSVIDYFSADMPIEAYKAYTSLTDADERVACWSFLDSKQRRTLKTLEAEQQAKAN